MKVIKAGKLPGEELKNQVARGVCSNCRCEIECTLGEATNTLGPGIGDRTSDYFYKCPTEGCSHLIHLKAVVFRS